MLRTLEPEIRVENKNAEADFKNPCSYKVKSVYVIIRLGFAKCQKPHLAHLHATDGRCIRSSLFFLDFKTWVSSFFYPLNFPFIFKRRLMRKCRRETKRKGEEKKTCDKAERERTKEWNEEMEKKRNKAKKNSLTGW